ncbi:MAG: 5'-nucleotidase, lipoprotein e(P4) family [Chlorobi bacterium]|nr:5'-nucleotidase, lipoprotein e(P4) family [Chlorobiota bacterium]
MFKFKIFLFVSLYSISFFGFAQQEPNLNNPVKTDNEHLVQATLWFQQSAEMRAIYYQTYQMAQTVLNNQLSKVRLSKPAAVVLDIDETVLDNSPFETESIRTGENYSKARWKEWTAQKNAKPLPGAKEFVLNAKEKGVEVFYISNRYYEELGVTISNLKKYDFPFADSAHVLLKKETSDKTKRRNSVLESHVILMFVGDNLTDFSQEFAHRDKNLGFDLVEKYKADFGTKFIILPNPMYGEWENAIYENKHGLTNEEKDKKRKNSLIGYEKE